ncbi:unnamed protein product, partial [marine sediment metagenome]
MLVVDDRGGLIGEWFQTCGAEYVKNFLVRWEPFGAVTQVNAINSIGFPFSRQLTQLGFKGTVDRLILRIAIVTDDKTVTSEDSDFWDPSQPKRN